GDPWVKTYGATAWIGYVQQPAFYLTNAYQGGLQQHFTGNGIVAVIDTGVDSGNPILAPVLVPGYDFTRNVPGYASDLADINQSIASILEQSTASILEVAPRRAAQPVHCGYPRAIDRIDLEEQASAELFRPRND